MLKYLPDEVWNKLPLADYRARFFVETYTEKLRLHTPHFYQSRLMNVFSSCSEMLTYIHDYQSNKKNYSYISLSLDEIEETWEQDEIANVLLKDLRELRNGIFQQARNNQLKIATLSRLKGLCRAVVGRQNQYSKNLLEALEQSLLSEVDLSKKARILDQIYKLTGLYITHLLNRGHSPTYLFNRAQMFTRENNYSGRDFTQQFRRVTEKLGNRTEAFEVCFWIRTNKPSILLSIDDEQNFSFSEEPPADIPPQDVDKLKKNLDLGVFVKSSIESTDSITAAFQIKERLDRFLDAVTALELTPYIQVSSHCYSLTRINGTLHGKIVSVDMLLAFMSSEVGTYFSRQESSIRLAFKGLDDLAKDQLGRSLRYLRLARDSVSMEQKLLNLWIALESLFERRDSAVLPNILEIIPKLYAVAGLHRRVGYLRDLLAANQIPTTPIVKQSICSDDNFSEDTTDKHVFMLLRDEAASTELFQSLGQKEHLKFKLRSVFDELKNNSAISKRLEKSTNDVFRQLRRIYFLRNKIAHTGHHRGVRPQLATHLLDYIAVSYKAIVNATSLAENDSSYSIAELLLAARMGADIVVANAESPSPISNIEQLLLVPVV